MKISLKSCLTLALLSAGLPADSRAQSSARSLQMADSSVARIVFDARAENQAVTRRYSAPDWVVRILRQSDRAVAAAKIEELADSLTRIVIRGDSPGQPANSGWAFPLLVFAGTRDHSHGRPFEGVVDRLIRISAEAPNPIMSGMARHAMLGVIRGERAIPHLRELAMRREPANALAAADAVGTLVDDAMGGGMRSSPHSQHLLSKATLKELFDGRLITATHAQSLLEAYATTQGWRRPP